MIISHALRCIFVHVQKTAGTSIEAVLRRYDPECGSHLHQGRRHAHVRARLGIAGELPRADASCRGARKAARRVS